MRCSRVTVLLCLVAQLAGVAPSVAGEAPVVADDGKPRIPREAPAVAGAGETREAPLQPRASNRRRWGLALSGVGLAAGAGLAMYLKSEADDRYDLYLATADPARARDHFDAAQRYDRATLIGWVVAQASFVGLVYFLIHEDERPLVPVRGEPLVRPSRHGFEVGVTLWP